MQLPRVPNNRNGNKRGLELFLKINNRGEGGGGGINGGEGVWKIVLFSKTFKNKNLHSLSNAMSSFLTPERKR